MERLLAIAPHDSADTPRLVRTVAGGQHSTAPRHPQAKDLAIRGNRDVLSQNSQGQGMQNVIGFLVWIGLGAFATFWPYGVLYAVFALGAGVLLGAWAFNCTKLQHRLVFSAVALAMGLLTVVSLVIALHPGTGTFVFGRGPVGLTLSLTHYGLAQQLLSIAWLWLTVAPGLLGALLARGVRNRIQRRDTIPGTPGAA